MDRDDVMRETLNHLAVVRQNMATMQGILTQRMIDHDASKFSPEEFDAFVVATPSLKTLTYGSKEYKDSLDSIKLPLRHHYSVNRHHPEHFGYQECNGCFKRHPLVFDGLCECGYSQFTLRCDISQMNLLDLLEMLCDWQAATLRHADGDLASSIEKNQERFGYSDETKAFLINTSKIFTGVY